MSAPMTSYTANPLDETYTKPVDLSSGRGQLNWGPIPGRDRGIVFLQGSIIKSPDERLVINRHDGFARIWTDSELDVVDLFFRECPDRYLAETFVFQLFYNHVEELAVSTAEFKSVRDEFLVAIEKNRDISTYTTIITILDKLPHGPRMVMARYLVEHINRALRRAVGMEANPAMRIKFNQIEDLEELLGPNIDIPLLKIPGARTNITRAVNTAVFNALTGYSDVLFADQETFDPAIIKTSPVFPFSMDNVYPTKAIIPDKDSKLFPRFFEAMQKHQLSGKTFVRSIRSVIITNILGQQALSEITDKPKAIGGQIPALLNSYLPNFFGMPSRVRSECSEYDEFSATGEGDGADYEVYLENPSKYEAVETDKLSGSGIPSLPVDQSVFAIQYKKSPYDYLQPLDLLSTMDGSTGATRTILVRKEVTAIHPTV